MADLQARPLRSGSGFDADFAALIQTLEADLGLPRLTPYGQWMQTRHRRLVPFFPAAGKRYLDEVHVELTLDRSLVKHAKGMTTTSLRGLLELDPDSEETTGRWVVLGDPGSGKSTIARFLAFQLAGSPDGPIPVYVSLPQLAERSEHPFELTERLMRMSELVKADSVVDMLRRAARTPNRVWLLLDGLDEVSPGARADVVAAIHGLAESMPHARLCVFSRAVGYRERPLGDPFREAAIQSLDDGQRLKLLTHWIPQRATSVAAALGG